MARLSDAVGPKIEAAISKLEIPQVARDSIEWELTPALIPQGRDLLFGFMISISLPVPGSGGDYVLHTHPMVDISTGEPDPHADQDSVSLVVRKLYEGAQAEADEEQKQHSAPANGTGKLSPGGLHLP